MNNGRITKEDFVNAINRIQSVWDFENDISDVFRKYQKQGAEGYVCSPNMSDVTIKLLAKLISPDKYMEVMDWIDYFCYERDFGRDYQLGNVRDKNGSPIPFGNVDDVWEFLENEYIGGC